jgi:hypothetical protein
MTTDFATVDVLVAYPDPFNFPGSGSISYSNEHNRMNCQGKFDKEGLMVGP